MDIHAEKGMQCADCHFAQDSHGNGLIHGEVANAVEIGCQSTVTAAPTPIRRCAPPTSLPRRRQRSTTSTVLRNPDGQRRFEWMDRRRRASGALVQRSIIDPDLEWRGQPGHQEHRRRAGCPFFNVKAARAKLMSKRAAAETGRFDLRSPASPRRKRAHEARSRWLASPATCRGRLQLRRLPPADRGELEDRPAIKYRGGGLRATSRPTIPRSRATTCSSSAST